MGPYRGWRQSRNGGALAELVYEVHDRLPRVILIGSRIRTQREQGLISCVERHDEPHGGNGMVRSTMLGVTFVTIGTILASAQDTTIIKERDRPSTDRTVIEKKAPPAVVEKKKSRRPAAAIAFRVASRRKAPRALARSTRNAAINAPRLRRINDCHQGARVPMALAPCTLLSGELPITRLPARRFALSLLDSARPTPTALPCRRPG